MLVKFKQAVHLHGKDYPRGIHEVPEKVRQDKYFHRLIQAGLVEDGEAKKIAAPISPQDQEKMLAAAPVAVTVPKLPASEQALSPQAGDESGDETLSSPPSDAVEEDGGPSAESEPEAEEQPKGKKQKNKKR